MKDSIINGTGDSRYMKSNIPENITFAEFIAMLREGTFPFDLNGINPDAWKQIGDPLDKNTLLKDETALFLGLPITAVPDDAFLAAIKWSLTNEAIVVINVALTDGTPLRGIPISGTGIDGYAYTDDGGQLVMRFDTTTTTEISYEIVQPFDLTSLSLTSISTKIQSKDILIFTATADLKDLSGTTHELQSGTFFLSEHAPKATFWGCGGGASGAVGGTAEYFDVYQDADGEYYTHYSAAVAATSGAGGKTAQVEEPETDIRHYSVSVGAGGGSKTKQIVYYDENNGYGAAGSAGGTTKITNAVTSETVLSASGGGAGAKDYKNSTSNSFPGVATRNGSNGGSGSGGCIIKSIKEASIGASGSNGGSGGTITYTYRNTTYTATGGTGQGTTTYPFGDTTLPLCCTAGTPKIGTINNSEQNTVTTTATGGTNPGDGGGAAIALASNTTTNGASYIVQPKGKSGAGKAGTVYVRFAA